MDSRDEQITLAVIATELKHTNRSLDSLTTELRQQRETSERRFGEIEAKLSRKADAKALDEVKGDLKKANWIVIAAVMVMVLASAGISVKSGSDNAGAKHVVAASGRL